MVLDLESVTPSTLRSALIPANAGPEMLWRKKRIGRNADRTIDMMDSFYLAIG
jgi:hypothetical protein